MQGDATGSDAMECSREELYCGDFVERFEDEEQAASHDQENNL